MRSNRIESEINQIRLEGPAVGARWLPMKDPIEDWVDQGSGLQGGPRNTGISQATERLLQQALLPATKLKMFKGDCTQFAMFLKTFEAQIEKVTSDANHCLQLLLQHLEGEPYTLVHAYQLYSDPEEAYFKAKEKLLKEYGHPVRQTAAFRAQLMNWPHIRKEAAGELRKFRVHLELCQEIKSSGVGMSELDSPPTLLQLVKKLPERARESWSRRVCRIEETQEREADFSDFVTFVRAQSDASCHPVYGSLMRSEGGPAAQCRQQFIQTAATTIEREHLEVSATPTATTVMTATSLAKGGTEGTLPNAFKPPCLLCGKNHKTAECNDASVPLDTKKQKLKGLCFSCLNAGHFVRRCRQRATCSICQGRHPTLLHDPNRRQQGQDAAEAQADAQEMVRKTNCASQAHTETTVVMATVPVRVYIGSRKEYVTTTALLDTASTATFITTSLLQKLGIEGQEERLEVSTMSEPEGATMATRVVQGLRTSDVDGNEELLLPPVYVVEKMPFSTPVHPDINQWPHLQTVPVVATQDPIELLVGIDVPAATRPLEVRAGADHEPYAQRTKLGWYVNGPFPARSRQEKVAASTVLSNSDGIQSHLNRLFFYDFKDAFNFVDKGHSQEDVLWLQLVNDSIQRNSQGQYEIALPFKSLTSRMTLADNRDQALRRLALLARKFASDQRFKQDYVAFIKKMEDSDYVEEVVGTTAAGANGVCYIPHHGVYHPRKGKIRVVFNCANRFCGTALNDCLLAGPDLINSLVGVLIRFREHPVAFMADIESMFYRVMVPEQDRDCLRYLWWPGGVVDDQNIKTYRLKVHLFGATSSPSVANFALRRSAEDAASRGLVAEDVRDAVKDNFYVDDCLKSVEDVKSGIKMAKGLMQACSHGGFCLTKLISTSIELLQALPKTELAKELADVDLQDKKDPLGGLQERALGVMWCIKEDAFKFKIELSDTLEEDVTKRSMLSILSAVYDPLGFASPAIIRARICFREVTKDKTISWDDKIKHQEFCNWKRSLKDLEKVVVPRCFRSCLVKACELHVFCDASTDAYAAVAYLRGPTSATARKPDNVAEVAFVLGKARVSPPRVVTIPRLELTAAKLAVEMATGVQAELRYQVTRRVLWTDSQTVLKYLHNMTKRFHTFVANRVSAILNSSQLEEWRYVPTQMNPADEGTRGMEAKFLKQSMWLEGPNFLRLSEQEWPKQSNPDSVPDHDPEVKVLTINTQQAQIPFLDKLAHHYSSWKCLVKAAALWKRFLTFLQNGRRINKEIISLSELQQAEKDLLKASQKQTWPQEYSLVSNNMEVPKTSPLYALSPTLSDELINMRSRTKTMLPIVPHSRIGELIVEDAHVKRMHMGCQSTMAEVQQHWWVIGLGQTTRRIVKQCPACQRRHSKPMATEMAPLPDERLNGRHPFSVTGINYFGPLQVDNGKMYRVIFTCASSRAIHLEIAGDLSSSSFINALRRFIARRGHVKMLISDNGTSFEGAQTELTTELEAELFKLRQKNAIDKIASTMRSKGIEWKFNAPGAPHRGGFWERLIQTVKRCLVALTTRQWNADMLNTTICEVEAMLNNRPLTAVSEHSDDLEALTPNHLLLGRAGPRPPPGNFRIKPEPVKLRRRWRQTQAIIHSFWKRWAEEYKVLLHKRSKWHDRQRREPQVGDIVFVLQPLEPRQYWPLGMITAVHRSRDGLARTCEVRTNQGVFVRPITRLCPLETASQQNGSSN